MPQQIQLPDNSLVEFPDDMADEEISMAIFANFPQFRTDTTPKSFADVGMQRLDLMRDVGGNLEGTAESFGAVVGLPWLEAAKSPLVAETLKSLAISGAAVSGEIDADEVADWRAEPLPSAQEREQRIRAGYADFSKMLQTPVVELSRHVSARQFADAMDALSAYQQQTRGKLTSQETQALLAEPSRKPTTVEASLAGAQQAVSDAVSFFGTPLGILTLGAGHLPKAAHKAVVGLFVTDMARSYPDMVSELSAGMQQKDPERISRSVAAMGLTTTFLHQGGKSLAKPLLGSRPHHHGAAHPHDEPAPRTAAAIAAATEGKLIQPMDIKPMEPFPFAELKVGSEVYYGVNKGIIEEITVLGSGATSVRMKVTDSPTAATIGQIVGVDHAKLTRMGQTATPQAPATTAVKAVEDFIQFDQPKGEGIKARLGQAKENFQRLWVDDLRELEKFERVAVGGELAEGSASPTKIARMTTQASSARARSWATQGMTDFAGNKTGPALREIFGREGIVGDERQAIMYAVAKRAAELHGRDINPGLDKATVQQALADLETPARVQFAKDIHEWNRGALQYLKDAGGLTDAAMEVIGLQNQSYIPFFRVFEESAGAFPAAGRRIGDTPNVVQRIKGSERKLIDPTESMQQHANQIIAVADKVRIARAITELAEGNETLGQYVREVAADKIPTNFDVNRIKKQLEDAGADLSSAELDTVLTIFNNSPRNPQGQNIVSFVKDGKRKFYELDLDLYRTLQAIDHHQIHPVLDVLLGKPSRAVRLGATGIRAGFTLITNPIRDFSTLLLQTKFNPAEAGAKFFEHLGKQIGLRDNEIKSLWKATGGELSQPLGMDRASLQRAVDDVMANTAKQKLYNVVRHPVEAARQAMSFTEAAPRLAEFEMQLKRMGWKPGDQVTDSMAIEAANAAAEVTLNFRRAGAYGRQFNQMVAFFNPNVQGLSKFARAHADNQKAAVMRGTALVTIPAIANWLVNKDDPEWQNFQPFIKYGFFNFKTPAGWVRVPTPFEWWYVYGATPMAALDAAYRKDPKAVTDLMAQAARQLTPPVIPSAVEPLLEAGMNRSFLTGRQLVPKSQERLDPREQQNPYTTETAKAVSKILGVGGVEVSPIKVDHVVRGLTGGMGTDIIQAGEQIAGKKSANSTDPADIPIVGRLFIRDSGGVAVDEFYSELSHLETKKATFDKLMKSKEHDRAESYRLEPGELQKLVRLRRALRPMQTLRGQLDDAETRADRKEIYRQMRELSERVLEMEPRP